MKNRKRHHVIYQINNNAGTCSRNRENECLIWEKEGCQSETIRQSYSSLHPRHIPGRKRIDCVSSRGNCFHNTNISKKMSKPLGVNYCACINKIAMNKIFLIIILLCTLSCKNEMEELNIPSFNLMSNMQNAKLSDFVDSIQYIPLETNDSTLIGSISRIIATPNKIFVGDRVAEGVFVFDKKGKFINRICRQGRGPEEYVRLYDFDINEQDSSIYFYCGNKIQVYDYKGYYKYSIPINKSLAPTTIAVSTNSIYFSMNYNVYNDEQPFNSVFINLKGKIIEKTSPYSTEIAGQINYSPRLYFRFYHDSLIYFNNFENIVYTYKEGISNPIFKMEFNNYEVPHINEKNIGKLLHTRFHDYALPYNIAKLDNKYYILFLINDSRYMSIIHPEKNTVKTINISKDLKYDNSLAEHFLDFNCIENNCFVTYYDWSDVPELFSELKLPDDHNPIIVFYHIK